MSAKERIVQFQTIRAKLSIDAKEVLELGLAEGFESVILMGFKNGEIYIKSSANKSTLEVLGALEAAKIQLWEGKA